MVHQNVYHLEGSIVGGDIDWYIRQQVKVHGAGVAGRMITSRQLREV